VLNVEVDLVGDLGALDSLDATEKSGEGDNNEGYADTTEHFGEKPERDEGKSWVERGSMYVADITDALRGKPCQDKYDRPFNFPSVSELNGTEVYMHRSITKC
jgi:hypothetical protein